MITSRLKFIWAFVLLCCLLVIQPNSYPTVQANNGNVLVNGDFEEEDPATHGFIWYPPNHYLAPHWFRWWVNSWPSQPLIPEYDDMRPTSGRWPPVSGVHSQVYFKWGSNYQAGVYQVVENLTPCVPYEFSMYVNSRGNEGTEPHARIALDPQGTQITLDHVHNDLIGGQMPPLTAWSAEQTTLFTWDRLVTTAEPLGTRMTAITFANPIYYGPQTPWYDTWWDNGVLQQIAFPNGKLPEPASWSPGDQVSHSINGDMLNISWNTSVPASTQVWYQIMPAANPITTTLPTTGTVFLPLVMTAEQWQITPLDTNPTTQHNVSISGMGALQSGDKIIFKVLSRRPGPDACVTEGFGPIEVTKP
ncbi:MAG: hypothetical protein JW892_08530 [Anaerolineae bacterium]|nr:hypothetical protein [Anaerolineae bacterium]